MTTLAPTIIGPGIAGRDLARPVDALDEIWQPGDLTGDDERLWVPVGDRIWSRPLCLHVGEGYWVHLLRVRRAGFVNRHRHPGPVHIWTIVGQWRYPERDWVAGPGSYVFEPPGDVHTLTIPEGVPEMIFLSNVKGALIYVDEAGATIGHDDVFSRIAAARAHYVQVGLGADFVRRFIR